MRWEARWQSERPKGEEESAGLGRNRGYHRPLFVGRVTGVAQGSEVLPLTRPCLDGARALTQSGSRARPVEIARGM